MISLQVKWLDILMRNIGRLGKELARYLAAAGKEAGSEVIITRGLKLYPSETEANQPPTPYWIRGLGMERAGKRKPAYNDRRSERYGSQFYATISSYVTKIGNRASYGKHLAGEEQAKHMGRIGWRRLIDVAEEKRPKLVAIFQAWIDKLIRDLGLQ